MLLPSLCLLVLCRSSEAALTACAGMCTSQRTLPVRPQALLSSALAVAGLIQGTEPLLQQSVLITDSSYFFRDFDAIAAGICRYVMTLHFCSVF